MDKIRKIKANCLCGAVAHHITLAETAIPLDAAFCHCTSCRRMSGCLCITSISLSSSSEKNHYQPSEQLLEKLKPFEFSKDAIVHYFCPTCGTHMLARVLPRKQNGYQTRWFGMCGTFQSADSFYRPRHEYIADTLDGGIANLLVLTADHKQIERWPLHPGDGEQLPLDWLSLEQSRNPPYSAQKLHAHCKCYDIEFWITRLPNGSRYTTKLCVCNTCRLSHGMEWFAGVTVPVPASKISLDQDGLVSYQQNMNFGTLRTYQSSPTVIRSFCSTCGATVFLNRNETNTVEIAIGILDAAEGARAESWLEWSAEVKQLFKNGLMVKPCYK